MCLLYFKYCILLYFLLPVPAPVSVTITSDLVSPIRPVGSDVTLTCTAEWSSGPDDDPLNKTMVMLWSGPSEVTIINTIRHFASGTTTGTSTAMISSFGRAQSGVYTCSSTVCSSSPSRQSCSQNGTTRVTVGMCVLPLMM